MDQFNDYLASEGFINHHNLMFQHSVDLEASLLDSFAEEVLDLTHDTSAPQDNTMMCFPPFNSSLSLPTFDDSHSAFFVEPFQPVIVGAGIPNDFQMPSSFPFSHQPFQPLYHHQQTHHHQQYQEQGFNSVSPSPSLESPYSSLHGYSSSTPPHTPTCLPLSIVAPSSTSMFYLDTHCVRSSPAPLESTTTTTAVQPVKITIPSTRSMHFSPLPTPVQRSPLSSFISTTQLLATEKRAASPFVESPRCESVEPASPSSASLPEITLPSTTTTTTTSTRKPKPSKSASTHSDSVYSPRKSSTTSKRSSTQQSSSNATAAGSTMGVKKRHILKERETKMLNEVFESTRFLQASQAAELAAKMGMTVTQIRIWFQNKRAFVKRQSSALTLQSDD
ncbi:hypothetical protein BJ741DRAFT_670612 [Chytriomyces cf. hyalinus JEL632]|nr:hypothetical protein BJ741DRAFT_670612 [Chytriomyces cf. hyalinus JEL632]